MKVAIIGGGAAGFFAAISCKTHYPDAEVSIIEKTTKLLAKVRISGGGRCNVTHDCLNSNVLSKSYPRGERFLKKAFNQFAVADTIEWFESRGVKLKIEQDGRMFPVSDNSETIIDCLMNEVKRLGISIRLKAAVGQLFVKKNGVDLVISENKERYDKVIIATGGSPKMEGFNWLEKLGHEIKPPVPSLFTFNMPSEPIKSLMGLVVSDALIRVQGTKLKQKGPLLVTHWGMSGPAILKTSAWGARILSDMNYEFNIQVSWVGEVSEVQLRNEIIHCQTQASKKKMTNKRLSDLPTRLWDFLLHKIELREDITWGEIGKKGVNKLINILMNDVYRVSGKTTFKEEFVTCGGISLENVKVESMESKITPNLFFAGEVLDIDGVTGGFNFQAAWTTGYIAGKLN